MDQCSILYVWPTGIEEPRVQTLRSLGFRVDQSTDLPPSDVIAAYHAVIVRPTAECDLPMLATRLRAKPHFGRRILIALVPEDLADRDKRGAVQSGFDRTLPVTCGARSIAATVLRLLRPYPEFRCMLRVPGGRHKAA